MLLSALSPLSGKVTTKSTQLGSEQQAAWQTLLGMALGKGLNLYHVISIFSGCTNNTWPYSMPLIETAGRLSDMGEQLPKDKNQWITFCTSGHRLV